MRVGGLMNQNGNALFVVLVMALLSVVAIVGFLAYSGLAGEGFAVQPPSPEQICMSQGMILDAGVCVPAGVLGEACLLKPCRYGLKCEFNFLNVLNFHSGFRECVIDPFSPYSQSGFVGGS